jgi:hypothetical protein
MIKLNPLDDNEPLLKQSKLFHALERTIRYAEDNGGIGLTQTKAFNRKFAHWGAQNFNWPDYSEEKLLRVQKVLNEWDVPPVMVIHDVMSIAKWGRHIKGRFQLSKSAGQSAEPSVTPLGTSSSGSNCVMADWWGERPKNDQVERTFVRRAANTSREPIFPDTVLCTDVWFSRSCHKRAKTKLSFAKGLCHKILL